MSRRQYLLLLLSVILLSGVIFQKQLATHLKIALFITEEFPQIPIKPLGLLSKPPTHQKVELDSQNGKIVGDLFTPVDNGPKSALIVAMGVKTAEDDKPLILNFSDALARLGYVVFWPRQEVLDKGVSLPEEPGTFIKAFEYLEKLPEVDPKRISYVGFSVGSSTAFVAASDPEISNKVHGLVFFGGQFDLFEYLLSLASKTYEEDGARVSWDAAENARSQAKGLLKEATHTAKIFESSKIDKIQTILAGIPSGEAELLKRYSPKDHTGNFKAKIFILHDKSDTYVPYTESIRLNQALGDMNQTFLLIDLFDHVQPNRPINIGELAKLYGFLYKVLNFI